MVFYYYLEEVTVLFCTDTKVHLFTDLFGLGVVLEQLEFGYLAF